MDEDKLKKAILYSMQNPDNEFSIELKKRLNNGEFNSILKNVGVDTSRFEAPKKESFLKRFGKGLVKSEVEFGKSIAGAVETFTGLGGGKDLAKAQSTNDRTTQMILKKIKEKREKGEDDSKWLKLLNEMQGVGTPRNELLERQAGLSTRQVLGQAGGVLADVAGAGTFGKGFKTGQLVTKAAPAAIGGQAITGATTFLKGAGKGALTGAGVGAGFGAAQGLSRGMQEDRKGADLLAETVSGGLIGGALGGVIGGITGGISGGLRGKALRKQQLIDDLTNNPQTIAKYRLNDTGKIIKDKNAQEVLKQGLSEKHVALITNADEVTKAQFPKMFKLAEKASKDARVLERPADLVGDTITARTKHLSTQLRVAGKQVDEAATALKDKSVSPQPAVQDFMDDLADMGVTFKKGKPIFKGSDIEGIAPAENLIKKVVKRMQDVSDDALDVHKLKKFIDEQVTFGKMGEGLTGGTERVVKGLRANIDDLLDTNFTNYDSANSAYRVARTLFDETKSILGRKFDLTSGNIKAGAVARRILGNSANRGDIKKYLDALDQFYKATGGELDDDIVTQIIFSDILEDIFGTQATTGLQGQVQRGVEQAGGVAQDVAQGQPLAAGVRGLVRLYQATRGISDEARIEAMARLIGVR